MDKLQYIKFMQKYASKDYLKNCILKKRNADGKFTPKHGVQTINLQKKYMEGLK